MSKKQFLKQCNDAIENFNNGKERLAKAQVKTLEPILEKHFKEDVDCINAICKVWELENIYHKKNINK